VARLGRDALEPCTDRRVRLQVEAALVRDVCVGVERNVGDRHPVADEPVAPGDVLLHPGERAISLLEPAVQLVLHALRPARVGEPEPGDRDRGLVLVLLEEHPLEHLGPLEPVVGNERRALAEVPEDRPRLAERPAVVEDERGDPQGGVQVAEHLLPVRAVDDVHRPPLVRDPEVGQEQPDLVAVARDRAVVEQHAASLVGVSRGA
jgi:hypothetical protein